MSGRGVSTYDPNLVEVKTKFECEFRRFCFDRTVLNQFNDFYNAVMSSYHLPIDMEYTISYTDPRNGDLLPINNDDNLLRAFTTAVPLLRLFVYRKQDLMLEQMSAQSKNKKKDGRRVGPQIGAPQDFRRVAAIVDTDTLPDTVRRVKLLKQSTDRPLGFYIRDGTSVRVTPYGLEKVSGIFISRLVPGGLAEGTGLLSVNDEILEVNGIEVLGKSLDQVTDMMVANSQNLIITVKPATPPPETPRVNTQQGGGGSKRYNPSGSAGGGRSGMLTSSTPSKTSRKDRGSSSISESLSENNSYHSESSNNHTKKKGGGGGGGGLDRPLSLAQERTYAQNDIKRYSVGGVLDSS